MRDVETNVLKIVILVNKTLCSVDAVRDKIEGDGTATSIHGGLVEV